MSVFTAEAQCPNINISIKLTWGRHECSTIKVTESFYKLLVLALLLKQYNIQPACLHVWAFKIVRSTATKFKVRCRKVWRQYVDWPRIWSCSGYRNKPSILRKEEMELIEQSKDCQIFKECSELWYCLLSLVYCTCDRADRAALSKLLGRLSTLQFFSTWTFESVALYVSRVTLTHDAVHWTKRTNHRMPRGPIWVISTTARRKHENFSKVLLYCCKWKCTLYLLWSGFARYIK